MWGLVVCVVLPFLPVNIVLKSLLAVLRLSYQRRLDTSEKRVWEQEAKIDEERTLDASRYHSKYVLRERELQLSHEI